MAATRAVVRGRIQEILGDVNPSERVVGQFRYDEVIARNMHLIAARCVLPRDSVTSITLVANTYDYAAHATLQYQSITQALLNSTGRELNYVPMEQFNAYYRQDTAEPRESGEPREYTIYENTSNLVRVRFGPTPNASDTAKFHATSLPALLTADSSSIPFSNDLLRGLESACAAELVLALSPDALAKLGLDKSVAGAWTAQTERAIHDHNVRQQAMGRRQNHILRHRGRRVADRWGAR